MTAYRRAYLPGASWFFTDKLALSTVPTYITTVNVPAGTPMRVSVANGIMGNKGGAVQFEVVSRPPTIAAFNSWFVNARPL